MILIYWIIFTIISAFVAPSENFFYHLGMGLGEAFALWAFMALLRHFFGDSLHYDGEAFDPTIGETSREYCRQQKTERKAKKQQQLSKQADKRTDELLDRGFIVFKEKN